MTSFDWRKEWRPEHRIEGLSATAKRAWVRTAIHEAGHVVVAMAIGYQPEFASIQPGLDGDGRTVFGMGFEPAPEDLATILLAGGIAEERLIGRRLSDRFWNSEGPSQDLRRARREIGDSDLSEPDRRARRLVKARWRTILAIADFLLIEWTMNGDRLREIFEAVPL